MQRYEEKIKPVKKNFQHFFVSFKNVRIFAADLNGQENDCDALSFLEFSRLRI